MEKENKISIIIAFSSSFFLMLPLKGIDVVQKFHSLSNDRKFKMVT